MIFYPAYHAASANPDKLDEVDGEPGHYLFAGGKDEYTFDPDVPQVHVYAYFRYRRYAKRHGFEPSAFEAIPFDDD